MNNQNSKLLYSEFCLCLNDPFCAKIQHCNIPSQCMISSTTKRHYLRQGLYLLPKPIQEQRLLLKFRFSHANTSKEMRLMALYMLHGMHPVRKESLSPIHAQGMNPTLSEPSIFCVSVTRIGVRHLTFLVESPKIKQPCPRLWC